MKKVLITIFALFMALFNLKADAYQISADIKTRRIPMGTKLELEMANPVTTANISAGDMFSAYLTRDVKTQSAMILPRGTIVRGNIEKVQEAKRFSKSAILYLTFDHVVAPNGSQIPIVAGISSKNYPLDDKGGIKGKSSYITRAKSNWNKAGGIIKKSTKWGITSGEELFTGGKYLVTPFSAIGGTIAGGGYLIGQDVADLFRKGDNVAIQKGEVFEILLLEALDVPVSE